MRAIAFVGLLAVASLGGCSEDDTRSAAVGRYCRLSNEFQGLPRAPDAEPEQFQENMARYLAANDEYFDDLVKAAPDKVKADWETLIASLRRVAAGELQAFDDLNQAGSRIIAYEEKNC